MTLEQIMMITEIMKTETVLSIEEAPFGGVVLSAGLHKEILIWSSGNRTWKLNGRLHREDGPAVVFVNGGERCYLNGRRLSPKQHALMVAKMRNDAVKSV